VGVTFDGTNALRRAANITSHDPSFSAGAQAAEQNILRESEEGNTRIVPQTTYSDVGSFTGQCTVYSGLGSDSEDESATPEDNLTVPESAWTRQSASTPPADRSRAEEGRRRHEDLAQRLGLSPSSERGTTEGASSYPDEAFREGLLCSARSKPCATEEASLYVTEEFEDGLTLSNSAGRSAAEAASPQHTETVKDGFVPSVVPDAAEIGISDGHEISSTVVADGSPIIVIGTSVPQQLRSAAEEASPHPTETVTNGFVPSNAEEIGVSDGSEISSAGVVGGPPTVAKGTTVPQKPTNPRRIIADDIMSYAYPKYSYHPDAAAHVKQFRSIWAVNHGTQGLSPME
jgi:hypothetical protein